MSTTQPLTQRPTLLLIEDDARLRRAMLFLLEVGGYAVIEARDGMNALEMLQIYMPDVIVSDIDMPHMDGYELLRLVRGNSHWQDIPFVFASERYEYHEFMFALELGADEYLPKPFDSVEMLTTIDRALAMGVAQPGIRHTA